MRGSAVTLDSTGDIFGFRMNQTSADLDCVEPLFKTINVFRFAGSTLRETLVPALDRFITSGGTKGYVEQFMGQIIAEYDWKLAGAYCGDTKWFEIDSEADLRTAEKSFGGHQETLRPSRDRCYDLGNRQ